MKQMLVTICLLAMYTVQAQSPRLINYQGVVRGAGGIPLVNRTISVKFELRQGNATGTNVWESAESVTTNMLGLFNARVGAGNAAAFSAIDWNNGPYFLAVSVDTANGSAHTELGIQQLASVPYALHALSVPATYTNDVLSIGDHTFSLSSGKQLIAGSGLAINSDTIINTAPDQSVTLNAGTNMVVNGTYPDYTVSATPSLVITGNLLSISGGNTISLPPATEATVVSSGAAITTTLGNNSYSLHVPTPTISAGNQNITISGAYPAFSISSSPGLALSSGSVLSISGGNSVTLPQTNLVSSGTATTTILGPNSFSVHVPPQNLALSSGSVLSISGGNSVTLPQTNLVSSGTATTTVLGPNSYSVHVPPQNLSLSSGSVLSISGGNSVNLPQTSVVSTGAATTTVLGPNSFSMHVPPTGITAGNSNITVGGAYPNYNISSSPSLAITGNSLLSISNGNTVTLPARPTVTAAGLAQVSGGPNYTITVPLLTYNNSSGVLSSGTNSVNISPSLALTGSTLSVGAPGNTVNLATVSPWKEAAGTVTLSNAASNVAIGRSSAGLNGGAGRYLTVSSATSFVTSPAAIEIEGASTAQGTAPARIDFNSVGTTTVSNNIARIAAFRAANPNEGVLSFATSNGGSLLERMKIMDNGRVGIGTGTSSVNEQLQIQSAGGTSLSLLSGGAASSGILFGTENNHGAGRINFFNNNKQFHIFTNPTSGMIIDSMGRMAINANPDPLYNTHVYRGFSDYGPGKAALSAYREGSVSQPTQGGTGWTYNGVDAAIKGGVNWGNNFSAAMAGFSINDYANSTAVIGSEYSGSYWGALAFNDGTRRWGVYTPNDVHIGGATGIGTAAPTASLHVQGSVRIVDGTQGADKVLTSDAAGNASWTNGSMNTGFNAMLSTAQSVPNSAATIVNFNVERFDDGNLFSGNSYTCPTTGVYHFDASVSWNGFVSANNWTHIYIYRNSNPEAIHMTATSTGFFSNNISADIKCNANDVITVRVFQQSGANQTIYTTTSSYTYFSGHRVY